MTITPRYPAFETAAEPDDARLDAPAFHRNATPIVDALRPRLTGAAGDLFEIGSGSGRHAALLAQRFPAIAYWPSDPNPHHRASVDAWARWLDIPNLRPAIDFDATSTDWAEAAANPDTALHAILSINVIHIASWAVTEGLFDGAAQRLTADGFIAVYGPFRFHGRHVAASNDAFDRSLREENPDWGVRDVDDLDGLADARGMKRAETVVLPSNNHMLFFTR